MERNCTWMRAPGGVDVKVPPALWWLALTRAPQLYRYRTLRGRPFPLACRGRRSSRA